MPGCGIEIPGCDGIFLRGVVDQRVLADSGGVELPEGNGLAVGAPAEAVADFQLFFVDPVRGSVDEGGRAVGGEGAHGVRGEILHIDVVGADKGYALRVGRELREHKARLRRIAAEPGQLARCEIEYPVVAARVETPDLLRVGEDEQQAVVGRPGVVLDAEWLLPRCGN